MRSSSVPGLRRADLADCQRLLRSGSRSFHAASLLLPRQVRNSAAVVYAFCRTADDLVDSGHAGRWTIVRLRDRVSAVYSDPGVTDPVDRALQAVVRHHEIPRTVFDLLLEGFSWEIEGRQYESLSDVRAYSVRVAATVGVAMSHVMNRRDPDILERACHLGVAMQLTNISRDVGEDARAGRLYLPRSWMREAGINPDQWMGTPQFTPALASVIRRLLARARLHYDSASWGIQRLPARCRAAIRAASSIYADIGRVIAEAGFDSVSQRAVTSGRRKLLLAARAGVPKRRINPTSTHRVALPEAAQLISASHGGPIAGSGNAQAGAGGEGLGSRYVLQETS